MSETVIVTLITVVFGGLISVCLAVLKILQRNVQEINRGDGTGPRLYDSVQDMAKLVNDLDQWRHTYDNSPWRTGKAVESWVQSDHEWKMTTDGRLEHLERKTDDLERDINAK